MKQMKLNIVVLAILAIGCKNETDADQDIKGSKIHESSTFSKAKWNVKEDSEYRHREAILSSLLSSDTLKKLSKAEIINMLGSPDRIDNNHLFYTIEQKRISFFPLHTKTMVVKMANDSVVEWVKVHK